MMIPRDHIHHFEKMAGKKRLLSESPEPEATSLPLRRSCVPKSFVKTEFWNRLPGGFASEVRQHFSTKELARLTENPVESGA
jgi:hypothetical protein